MKTAIEMLVEYYEELVPGIENVGIDKFLDLEKQQHEQTAIAMTNVFMDALDNPKGGKFSGEDEFNKYWDKTYNV